MYIVTKNNWGIAIVSDGAGSAANSHIGSELIVKDTFHVFSHLLTKHIERNKLPGINEWSDMANNAFRNIYKNLLDFSKSKTIDIDSLACTVIVVVFTPLGLLSAHIGDGRAGYCNQHGEWKSLIKPHKGEEANQTIFISTAPWMSIPAFMISEIPVPECRIIPEKVIAFTLMSDGCETHSFECSKMDAETNKWMDPNVPSTTFFNPLLKQLKAMAENKESLENANNNWKKFIEEGTAGLRDESDDKSLIFGIFI